MENKYCIYLRKSRADLEAEARGEGETLSRHKTALTELAKRLNLNVSQIYKEIVSGETIAARPVMQQLLSEVGEGQWTGVLVMEIERLARGDTMDQGLVAQAFKYSETKIITPIKTYDPNNEFDEEYFEFGLFMARREYTSIKRRLQRGREASAKEGKFVGSIAPYGYKRKKIEGDKGYTLEIVPGQAEIVKTIFEWYTEGAVIDGERRRLGLQAIARRLNELNVPPTRNEYWMKETIKDILINPTYAGKIRWGYRKVKKVVTPNGKITSRPINYNDDCIIAKGLHEAIVSEETFDKAQKIISEMPPMPIHYKSEVKNPLAGLVFCSQCGKSMVLRRGTETKPDYLVCHRRDCKNVSTALPLVESRLLTILNEWVSHYKVSINQQKKQEEDHKLLTEAIDRVEKEIDILKGQLNKAYDFAERGVYTDEEFKMRSTDIKQRIATYEEQIKNLKQEYDTAVKRENARKNFVPIVVDLLSTYKTLSTKQKNDMLKIVIDHIDYNKEKSAMYRDVKPTDFTLTVYPRFPEN